METYTLSDGGQVEKYHVALLVNKGTSASPSWLQIASSTDNKISINAETVDRDFITDTAPTTIVKSVRPSLSQALTLFKGDDDYDYFFDKFYELVTGDDARGEMLIVFLNEASGTSFKAWLADVTYVIGDLDPAQSTLNFEVKFNKTVSKGTVTITDGTPVFTAS